jgi:hypothetical protein
MPAMSALSWLWCRLDMPDSGILRFFLFDVFSKLS